MGRKIHSRIKVSGTLVALSPLHVGGAGNDSNVDLALAVNGQGEYYIPGSSLAGALRAWMARDRKEQAIHALWGPLRQKGDAQGHASFVLVEDAPIQGSITVEVREGVGIDRIWGRAAEQFKYDRAILPRGCRIPLEVVLERDAKLDESAWQACWEGFIQLLWALRDGEIRLGAAKTRGLGRVRLENEGLLQQDLSSRTGMLQTLHGQGIPLKLAEIENLSAPPSPRLSIDIHWHPCGPLMVKAEREGVTADLLPLVSGVEQGLSLVLPGSALKGSLRTQAERIVRTVCGLGSASNPDASPSFADQLRVPLVQALFGASAGTEWESNADPHPCLKPGLGALSVDDCYAQMSLSPGQWAAVEAAASPDELRQALGCVPLEQAFHVAVDRWTGGAADSFLFSGLEPMAIPWQPLRLFLDLDRLREHERLPGVALLLLILRDLSQDRIPLGYGTNRGMGAVAVQSVTLRGRALPEPLTALANVTLVHEEMNGVLSNLEGEVLATLTREWQQWIEQQQQGDVL